MILLIHVRGPLETSTCIEGLYPAAVKCTIEEDAAT